MEELRCDFNQFDVPGGDVACTAIAMCYTRLVLEGHRIDKAALHRAMRAGAFAYRVWGATPEEPPRARGLLQCWADVRRSLPDLFVGLEPVFESNGFFGRAAAPAFPQYTTFADAMLALRATAPEGAARAGVLTSGGGSYGLAHDGAYWYLFDSHAVGGGVMRRAFGRVALARYIVTELLPGASGREQEFQVAWFAARPPPTQSPAGPAHTGDT
jgi:hypothetical protein